MSASDAVGTRTEWGVLHWDESGRFVDGPLREDEARRTARATNLPLVSRAIEVGAWHEVTP